MGERIQAEGTPNFGDLSVGQAFKFATSKIRATVMCKVGNKAYTPLQDLQAHGQVRMNKVLSVSDISLPVILA